MWLITEVSVLARRDYSISSETGQRGERPEAVSQSVSEGEEAEAEAAERLWLRLLRGCGC